MPITSKFLAQTVPQHCGSGSILQVIAAMAVRQVAVVTLLPRRVGHDIEAAISASHL
jgi:hypothetical protein